MNELSKAAATPRRFGLAIKQARGRITYDALIETGFKLLEERDLQDISIAELAKKAGYSVGAFYARFRSKDEFFDALVHRHLDFRTNVQVQIFSTLPLATLLPSMMHNIVNYYWEHRKFWRAVLMRSVRDPDSYLPMRAHRQEATERFINRMELEATRLFDAGERANIAFAFQVILGTIDSTIINEPGPVPMNQTQFIEGLARTFALVSNFDTLVSPESA